MKLLMHIFKHFPFIFYFRTGLLDFCFVTLIILSKNLQLICLITLPFALSATPYSILPYPSPNILFRRAISQAQAPITLSILYQLYFATLSAEFSHQSFLIINQVLLRHWPTGTHQEYSGARGKGPLFSRAIACGSEAVISDRPDRQILLISCSADCPPPSRLPAKRRGSWREGEGK